MLGCSRSMWDSRSATKSQSFLGYYLQTKSSMLMILELLRFLEDWVGYDCHRRLLLLLLPLLLLPLLLVPTWTVLRFRLWEREIRSIRLLHLMGPRAIQKELSQLLGYRQVQEAIPMVRPPLHSSGSPDHHPSLPVDGYCWRSLCAEKPQIKLNSK